MLVMSLPLTSIKWATRIKPLAGAKFKVVRQANNQVIGEYVTDEKGNITVNGLLKDKYILIETEAPAGYTIKEADTVVNAEVVRTIWF